LIEIKTHSSARSAIREALGQILEYAYYDHSTGVSEVALYIVGPGSETEECRAYIALLRSQFNIPVGYCQFSRGDRQLPKLLCIDV
jgi:hypothetical protein